MDRQIDIPLLPLLLLYRLVGNNLSDTGFYLSHLHTLHTPTVMDCIGIDSASWQLILKPSDLRAALTDLVIDVLKTRIIENALNNCLLGQSCRKRLSNLELFKA